MSFPAAIRSVLANYINFNGRAPRAEFWWWTLFNTIMLITPIAIGVSVPNGSTPDLICETFFFIYLLATILPNLALGVRRLHDTNHSGFWLLISAVPAGGIVLLVFYCMPSTPGPNRFGAPALPLGPLPLPETLR